MSQDNVQKFYEASLAAEDTQLLKSLLEGARGPADFIRNAVATATEQGYEFTEADAAAWIEKRQGERQDRELSDHELETVAGGKGKEIAAVGDAIDTAGNWTKNDVIMPVMEGAADIGEEVNPVINKGFETGLHGAIDGVASAGNWVGSWF